MRSAYKCFQEGKKSQLTPDRVERLESIGFKWRVAANDASAWDKKFELLKQFEQDQGHANVPRNDKTLGRWVATQRSQFKKKTEGLKTTMTDDRVNKLESIGFVWAIGTTRRGCRKASKKNPKIAEDAVESVESGEETTALVEVTEV